jgi:dihydrofolate synthase / folylpolyglutamate synthase
VSPQGGGVGRSVSRGPITGDPLPGKLFPPLPGEVRWGLERTRRILAATGEPLRTTPVLHVAGTNGKGTVARVWSEVLRAAGYRVGLYTSPELLSFRERFLVDGRPIQDERLLAWADELRPILIREGPTYFEAATALAFLAFEREEVDVAVMEVGLGGRLDATNVVSPVVTAITSVSMDHEAMLGSSVIAIAREKAGIFKPGVSAFAASDDPAVIGALTREAATLGVPLTRVLNPGGTYTVDGLRVTLATRRWGELDLESPLVGRHQLHNVALAVRSLQVLPPRVAVTAGAVVRGVAAARVPGRFQVEREEGLSWVLDVAHNPGSAAALAATLTSVELPEPRVGVVGMALEKDHGAFLGTLQPVLDHLILTVPPSMLADRRWQPEALLEGFPGARLETDFETALALGRELAGKGGVIVVTGSSAIVGDTLRHLDRIPLEALPVSGDFG